MLNGYLHIRKALLETLGYGHDPALVDRSEEDEIINETLILCQDDTFASDQAKVVLHMAKIKNSTLANQYESEAYRGLYPWLGTFFLEIGATDAGYQITISEFKSKKAWCDLQKADNGKEEAFVQSTSLLMRMLNR